MVFFSSWFRKNSVWKSKPEDYEQVLASLAVDIQKRQTRLSEIRLLYALAFWAAWGGMWYAGLLPNLSGHNRDSGLERTLKGIPVFLGPIVILFIRRIVQIWYTRIGDAEEKLLVTLREQRREKIEEIKNKTNYYSTRNLIERYDDAPSQGSTEALLRRRVPPQGLPATPQRASVQLPVTPAPLSPNLQQQLSPSTQHPLPLPRKQWFDKLADAILGDDDDTSASAATSRYALICQKCFAHNGLVKESMWQDTQYVCPKCGHFNPSARSMRQARMASKSPDSRGPTSAQQAESHAFAPPLGQPVTANGAVEASRETQRDEEAVGAGVGASARMDIDS